MEDKTISLLAHESITARMERSNVRAWTICVILIIALLGTNAGWLYYEHQFDDRVTTIEAEQNSEQGGANYLVNGNYGETESENNNQNTHTESTKR